VEAPPASAPVALDAHGTDGGPELVAEGASLAAEDGIRVRLFGPAGLEGSLGEGVELVPAEAWIGNDEEPVAAVRNRPEASVVRAAADVAAGRSSALVSAGSTGATMTAALFALKRMQGVHRPALAARIPLPAAGERSVLFLDVGANVEVRPQHLVQFAYLGSSFSEAVLGIERPRVALLSVGEEPGKGTPDVAASHAALTDAAGIEFVGNVEGTELVDGSADVVVTDGFTGNVALKLMEGTARAVAGGVREAARSNPFAALGGLLMRPTLGGLRRRMDPNATGGAILLGLRGIAVVAHGGSTPEGIANATRLAARAVADRAVERTGELLERSGATRRALRTDSSPDAGDAPAPRSRA
jgi:glycerol-3-phosphate acyltransferase PlsX